MNHPYPDRQQPGTGEGGILTMIDLKQPLSAFMHTALHNNCAYPCLRNLSHLDSDKLLG